MPEPFKNVFNPEFVQQLIDRIKSCYADFDDKVFQAAVFDNVFNGVVDQKIFEGDRMVYQIRCPALGDAVIFAFDHDPNDDTFYQKNETVGIGWNARDMFVYACPNTPNS